MRLVLTALIWCSLTLAAQELLRLGPIQRFENSDSFISIGTPAAGLYDVQFSPDLANWTNLFTAQGTTNGWVRYVDGNAPRAEKRFYRATQTVGATNWVGDFFSTTNGNIVVVPVHHASVMLQWAGKTIYADPAQGTNLFKGLPPADLIVITHAHGDHYDADVLNYLKGTNTTILAPQSVYDSMPAGLKTITTVLNNGRTKLVGSINVECIASYNTTSSRLSFHPQGRDNGYVLNLGGRRVYFSGDTEDVPEMRALKNIDIAFLCMNLPYTMDVNQAASAVRAFKPKVVYPYHFIDPGSGISEDLRRFKELVGTDAGVEVRLRPCYAKFETGDYLSTSQGTISIFPVVHASFAMKFLGKIIQVDPSSSVSPYTSPGVANLVLITHAHPDHFDTNLLTSIKGSTTAIAAPRSVYNLMPPALQAITTVLANGESNTVAGFGVEAVPMYNTTAGRAFHPKGEGNGYVLTAGGKRIYISGDTEDTPEMRALQNIDVAFINMSLPTIMDAKQAANGVRAFKPKIVYPCHFANGDQSLVDPFAFKRWVGTDLGIDVRVRSWYPGL